MGDSRVHMENKSPKKELVLIEYPGIVQNEKRMIKTLGGAVNISKVLSGNKKRLELKFHPDNIYCKPTMGDIQPTAGLLLKIKIRIPRDKEVTDPPTHSVEILGRCKQVVKFNSLMDFQYLPLLKNPENQKTEYIYDKVVPKGIPNPEWFSTSDVPLFLPPAIFARSDCVQINLYRGDNKVDLNDDILGVVKNRSQDVGFYQTFNLTDPVPIKPNPAVINKMTVKFISDEQLAKVKKCFDEKPIWPRVALLYETNIQRDKLKYILPSISYYFTTGPWRTMYVRYGYDPRKNYESRYYQTFDFRLRYDMGMGDYISLKRMTTQSMNSKLKASTSQNPVSSQTNPDYPYLEEGNLPRSRQCFYRYCDLHLPIVKEMLEKVPTPMSGATCNEKTGWLPPGFDHQCRQIVVSYLKEQFKILRKEGLQCDNDDDDEQLSEDEDDDQDLENLKNESDIEEELSSLLENIRANNPE